MINEYTNFICDECQHRFRGIAIQYTSGNNSLIEPVRCPMCGSLHTYPENAAKFNYITLWQQKEEDCID